MDVNEKAISHGKAAEQIARSEIEVITARIMDQMGFTHGTASTVDVLSDLAIRYLAKICDNIRIIKEHCGRGNVIIKDVQFAYSKMHINTDEVNEYIRQNRSLKPRMVPQFPAIPSKKANKTLQIAPPSEQQRDYFPSWAPPVYKTDLATTATSNAISSKNTREIIPDFFSFSAHTLGIYRYKVENKLISPKIEEEERPPSRVNSRTQLVESRPSSSLSKVPLFKRRKRKFETDLSINSDYQNYPSTSSTPPISREFDNQPAMISINTGTAAVTPIARSEISPSRLTHDEINENYLRTMPPHRIIQLAILKSIFTLESDLSTELTKAFEFMQSESPIQEEFIAPYAPTEPVYRIIKQDTGSIPGALAPLKLRISRASASGEPSPIGTVASQPSSDEMTSPKPKRHKNKKKKHKKEKNREEEVDPPAEETDSQRPAIRLKIRFGTQ